MRILHVVSMVDDHASYGGPLTVAINQCRELRRRGHDARLAAGWGGEGPAPKQVDGVPAHLAPIRRIVPGVRFTGVVAPDLLSWLRTRGASFDAAHLHLTRDLIPLMAGFWLRRAEVPYVTQTHGMVLPDVRMRSKALDRTLTLRVLRDAKRRFVLTGEEEKSINDLAGPLTTERLPNGLAVYDDDDPLTVPRQPGQSLNVLFMGRLDPSERVLDFARAAAELIAEGSDAVFSVAGPAGPELPALQAFIRADRQLRGRLVYEGPLLREESMERLARADVYVAPSATAACPMPLLEALAAATPSIVTTGCGIAAELDDAGAALVVAPGAATLAQGMRMLLSSQRHRVALSACAPGVVRSQFSMSPVAEQLIRAYRHERKVVNLPESVSLSQLLGPSSEIQEVPHG
jgi:glycosyltransferase involved in cell wall biosynthesis